jgi:succinate dehydrogenase hydrophobic anchor subunit
VGEKGGCGVIEAFLVIWLLMMVVVIIFGETDKLTEQGKWRLSIEFTVVILCLTLIEVFK